MRFMRMVAVVVFFGFLGAALSFWVFRWWPVTALTFQALLPDAHLPDFRLPDLDGKLRSGDEWRGKVVLLNFWATWCPPCRKEIPVFVSLQKQYQAQGLQFVGISIDQTEPTQAYAMEAGINYPVLIGDMQTVAMSRQLGNRLEGLPFSALFDRHGKLVFIKVGAVDRESLEKQILVLL